MASQRYASYRLAMPKLRERRLELGLTVTALAATVEGDFSLLARIERIEGRCAPELRRRLSEALELPEAELFEAEPTPRREPDHNYRVREKLMAGAGGCGSPTCQDHACRVEWGQCHAPDCTRPTTLARQTRPSVRWVKGEPKLYCSLGCAHSAYRAKIETLRQQGLIPVEDIAREVDRARRNVTHWKLGRQIPGTGPHGGAWFFTEEEADQIRTYLVTAPKSRLHSDPRWRADWYLAKHKSTKMHGRMAHALAAAKGKRVGRRSELSDWQVNEILERRQKGQSIRQIAMRVGVGKGQVERVVTAQQSVPKPPL